jgi:hypothetical protein
MAILKSALVYFVLVFGVGFLLGTLRVVLVVPKVGVRTAELIESPIMIAVTILAARWIVESRPEPAVAEFAVGILALGFLVIAEITLGFWLRGLSIRGYLTDRDPVSGTVYFLLLGLFAIMPFLFALVRAEGHLVEESLIWGTLMKNPSLFRCPNRVLQLMLFSSERSIP